MPRPSARSVLTPVAVASLACASAPKPAPAPAPAPLPLAPGIYQVSLKAPGYATWRAEVAIRSGTEPIRVSLVKKP